VFGISPSSSFFGIDGFGKRAVAAGSAASGLGLCIDAYFLLRYAGADAGKFQVNPTWLLFLVGWADLSLSAPRHGRLWWILLLLPILTASCDMHVCLFVRAYGLPDLGRMGGLEHRGDSDVFVCWGTAQPSIYRLWCAPVCTDYCSFLSSCACDGVSEPFGMSVVVVLVVVTVLY
jgi:hypothetical protein